MCVGALAGSEPLPGAHQDSHSPARSPFVLPVSLFHVETEGKNGDPSLAWQDEVGPCFLSPEIQLFQDTEGVYTRIWVIV